MYLFPTEIEWMEGILKKSLFEITLSRRFKGIWIAQDQWLQL